MQLGKFLPLAAVLACAVGCGPPKFYKCSGKVTHEGEPVPFVEIVFSPDIADSTRPPMAMSDKDGNFEMMCARNSGAPPGEYTIHIIDPAEADGGDTSGDVPNPEAYKYVVDRYSPMKSDLKYVADQHRTDFELNIDKSEYTGPEYREEKVENTTDMPEN